MAACDHPGSTVLMKFCPECGKRINIVQREPGELRALLNRLPEIIGPLAHAAPANAALVAALVQTTLAWALGEMSDEEYEKQFQPKKHKKES